MIGAYYINTFSSPILKKPNNLDFCLFIKSLLTAFSKVQYIKCISLHPLGVFEVLWAWICWTCLPVSCCCVLPMFTNTESSDCKALTATHRKTHMCYRWDRNTRVIIIGPLPCFISCALEMKTFIPNLFHLMCIQVHSYPCSDVYQAIICMFPIVYLCCICAFIKSCYKLKVFLNPPPKKLQIPFP